MQWPYCLPTCTLHSSPSQPGRQGLWRQIKLYTTIQHNSASLGGPWVLGVVRMENRDYCTFNNVETEHVRTDLSLSVALPSPITDWSTVVHPGHHATPHCTNYLITWRLWCWLCCVHYTAAQCYPIPRNKYFICNVLRKKNLIISIHFRQFQSQESNQSYFQERKKDKKNCLII